MKKFLLSFLIGLFGTLLNLSCEKANTDCGPVSFTALDLTGYPSVTVVDEAVEDKFLVINSQTELDQNATFKGGSGSPKINFSQNTLILGKKKLTGIQGKLISQTVDYDCGAGKLVYKATIQNGGYTALGNFYFAVVIPKANSGIFNSIYRRSISHRRRSLGRTADTINPSLTS